MGIFSEANAERNAKDLEKVILDALNNPAWSAVRIPIKLFVEINLIRWYYDEISETFGSYKAHPQIEKEFPFEKYLSNNAKFTEISCVHEYMHGMLDGYSVSVCKHCKDIIWHDKY